MNASNGRKPVYREPFPILYVADAGASARFYEEHFGFKVRYVWPQEGPAEFVYLRLGESGIGLTTREDAASHQDGPPSEQRFEICIYVDDVDLASEQLLAAEVRQVAAPEDMPWGERLAYFEDPDGNLIHITMVLDR